ncbi:2-amino-4-hydroxy-6-hydroxymethyldihydropteridine diphosphokinase [Aegicerativicinus sediminis]|uniref:2-amino-4-hydroxy-6- hydroxymethyldihydropteridine diphosphokinase n=1 Tax=Aegicerativicinus sediminis TaxID=2893202 RepID=UPI001E372A50|nr:2-amino-4-hydroxy-6-hydroxymethyldihydropteridine diphosphokinase [Aegicerativicinus sediminis]
MTAVNRVFLGLGSNIGDRMKFLQTAINLIFQKVGKIENISRVYETPSLGFEADDFLNCCVEVEIDNLNHQELLSKLQHIEQEIGRKPKTSLGYESRPIDIDVLLIDDQIIDEIDLQVPHPGMDHRNFVLFPLSNILPEFKHPISGKVLKEMLGTVEPITPINQWLKNPIKKYSFEMLNYLAIEGNIGAGKTSLASKISQDFNAKLILERFADNPFLPKFYKEPSRYAFTLEMSFLADRYQQINEDLAQLDLFKEFVVSDYDIFKSLIFSKVTLAEDEFRLYRKLFYLMYKDIAKPDLYIYLYQNTDRLRENIAKRGRDYEQEIQPDYLERINEGYLQFLKNNQEMPVKIIDISDKDFVSSRRDYLEILDKIQESYTSVQPQH